MKSIYDYTRDDLITFMHTVDMKKFRANQVFEWLYRKCVTSFDEMSNLHKDTRALLHERFVISPLNLVKKQVAKDGTTKYLFSLEDGSLVETVMMNFDYGNSICVSSQVGCNMGCTFCASGILKKKRNLSVGEMVSQVMFIQQELNEFQKRVSHIVVMGTGEPFDNYDNVINFLNIMNDDLGLAIGARHITISTCGVIPKILTFSKARYQYNLAISLHAPNDALRNQLMPINKAYPLKELMKALDVYMKENNRRLTFEYILLKGINDSEKHAKQLAKWLKGKNAYINLIPYNPVDEHGYRGVDRVQAMKFYDYLMKENVRVTLRKEHGSDIDAACGQLRAKELKKEEK